MAQLDLSPEETKILVEVLDTALSDLRMEIANTDSKDFRDMLKTRKAAIEKAIDGLKQSD